VRIDSGDLLVLGRKVRQILDEAGFPEVQIIGTAVWMSLTWRNYRGKMPHIMPMGWGLKMGVSGDASLDRYGLQISQLWKPPGSEAERR